MDGVTSTLVRRLRGPILSNRRPAALVIAVALGLLLAGVPKASADVNDPLSYYGGPIVHSPTAVIVEVSR